MKLLSMQQTYSAFVNMLIVSDVFVQLDSIMFVRVGV